MASSLRNLKLNWKNNSRKHTTFTAVCDNLNFYAHASVRLKDPVYFCFNRYITILYYLNDVEEGGETAFPVADNETFDQQVCDTRMSRHSTRHL